MRQCSPSTWTPLPQQGITGSVLYNLHPHISPMDAASKAGSTTSSRSPRPKSLTKFAAFESAFCKSCSSMLSAEPVFKGKAGCLTNSSTSDLTQLQLLLLQPQIHTKPPLLLPSLRKWNWTGALQVTPVPNKISRSFFTHHLRNKTSLNNSCLPPVCCSKIFLAGIHQSKP